MPADQTKTHLHTLSLVAETSGGQNHLPPLTRAAQSDEELYQIITDTEGTRMKRSYSVMSLFRRCEEKQYMVLMIVSGRSGSGKSVALRARWKIWVLLRG